MEGYNRGIIAAMLTRTTKAKVLYELRDKLDHFVIPKLMTFSSQQWATTYKEILKKITLQFPDKTLAIRSSACDEDGTHFAKAGEYESVLSVSANNHKQIRTAIERVLASYQRNGLRDVGAEDEIIVQEMLQNTVMSGVVFTHDLNTGGPYYVINYDDVSGLTNTVTSGDGEYANRTLCIHRGATQSIRSDRFKCLLRAVQELELVVGSQFLDIEFALGPDITPYLLQVRAISTQPNWNRAIAKRIDTALQGIQSFVRTRFQPMAGVFGRTTILGQMPDWNPAEMIGRAPRRLALSLYRTLITDHAWRVARQTMGYAVPAGQPLMVSLAGQPYIDTRLSFHSFLPAALSPAISNKLVDIWIKRLREHPELHDKVEFDVAITTYSFDISEKIKVLTKDVLNNHEKYEFKEVRKQQTIGHLKGTTAGSINEALARIEELSNKQRSYNLEYGIGKIEMLFGMIDDCISLGTIPFSILARHAFIARTLLLSLHRRGFFSMGEILEFQAAIRTIASDFVDDMSRFRLNELSKTEFMAKYGHLRPGTYDILSLRYDQMEDFGQDATLIRSAREVQKFILGPTQQRAINHLLQAEGFEEMDADSILNYIRKATIGREYGKFVFSRTVSDILEVIASYGEKNGLSREELSHLSISNLLEISTTSGESSVEDRLRRQAEIGAEQHALTAAIRLPQVLFDEAGVHVIPFQVSNPNFITNKKITATCVRLYAEQKAPQLDGKIVLIENADPGFDWIFSKSISGLITKYGGANSHMSIRCAEFGIPAAIGCGEQRFELLTKAKQIMLDCSSSVIQVLH